ncbi:MAG: DNA repair protein RecO, partial [Clostridia bacterium]|nr:DNA repair protein RecO [Clostridia bacterium]
MASLTITGIVLRYANYRDNDRILTIFTRERGTVSASARGCRRPGSSLLSCSEIFTYGEFVLFEGRGRYTVDACDVRERFYSLREDMDRLAAGAYMLSVTEACTPKGQQSEELFDLLYYALSYTAYGKQNPTDMAVCFLMRCLA